MDSISHKEGMNQLQQQHITSTDKYTYFLLAIVASAIAFSVQITKDATLEYGLIPLGIAVLLWGTSFFCGCKRIYYVNSLLYANFNFLKVRAGLHPDVGQHQELMQIASDVIKDTMKGSSNKAGLYSKLQFLFAVWGGVAFVCWHILLMIKRSLL